MNSNDPNSEFQNLGSIELNLLKQYQLLPNRKYRANVDLEMPSLFHGLPPSKLHYFVDFATDANSMILPAKSTLGHGRKIMFSKVVDVKDERGILVEKVNTTFFVLNDSYGSWVAFNETEVFADNKLGIARGYCLEEYEDETEATVYIYNYGLNHIGVKDFNEHLKICFNDVANYKGGKLLFEDDIKIDQCNGIEFSGFVFELDEVNYTALYLTACNNHFIKVRLTYDSWIDQEEMGGYKNLFLRELCLSLKTAGLKT